MLQANILLYLVVAALRERRIHSYHRFNTLRRNIPGLVIGAPADENEIQHMLKTAVYCGKPFILRYPRGNGFGVSVDKTLKNLPIGKGEWLKKGKDVNILAIGNRVHPALAAAEILMGKGIDCGVVNMRFLKPLDTEIIEEALALTPNLVTVEDNVLAGGFGSAVAEHITDNHLKASVLRLGIKDTFVEQATQNELYRELGLSAEEMAISILNKLKK
jgi:1-deoxy-D-xylulose-5-phosphate synthase